MATQKTKPKQVTNKTGRPRKTTTLPECATISAAVALTGVPAWVWSDAKRRGSPGFDTRGRLHPAEVLAWIFGPGAQGEDSTDWKGRRLKAQALREELELEVARGEVIPAAEVQRGISTGMSRLFAVWDRQTSLLPPRAKGLDERGIKSLLVEAAEEAKEEMCREFSKITKEQ